MGRIWFFAIFVVALAALMSAYAYPMVGDEVASHWNAKGEVNGYMSRSWGLFLLPAFMAGLVVLFAVIPSIDPLRKNIEGFRNYYEGFIALILLFMLVLHAQTILWNLGLQVSPAKTMPPMLGVLFYGVGMLLEKSKRNWFIGIRTPWTLSSDIVWDKTHKLGAKLYKICGALSFAAILFGGYEIIVSVAPILISSAYLLIYSYLEYRKINP